MEGPPSSAVSKTHGSINLAARLVSGLYDAINRPDLSGMIRNGQAEDFPEIKTAADLLKAETVRLERYEVALRQYADPGFWDDMASAGSLALYDGGEMARNVLAGRPAFYHRD
ncbi:hypothetical protein LH128_30289 [Sphingomonas sp. LH128]|uniref:hypothetical protein n=1 Tax=Sphingomonas sp. LH128 TaxID=473781 RepID=UPI00027CB2A0|nr:hypothetical protein [Sphingomonas sp. LH128]EJU09179.1 hypothetical protein LH128_30289 [Sphingomonas sp. LH128]